MRFWSQYPVFNTNPPSNWRGSGQKAVDASYLRPSPNLPWSALHVSMPRSCLSQPHWVFTNRHICLNRRFCWQFLRCIAGDTKVTPKNTAGKTSCQKDMSLGIMPNLKPHDPLLFNARRTSYPQIPHSSRLMVTLRIRIGESIWSDSDLIKHWQIKRCLAYSGIH